MPRTRAIAERCSQARCKAAVLAVAGLWVASSCGGDSTAGAGAVDLLDRHPDSLLDQPGRLFPDPKGSWGRSSPGGWAAKTELRGDERVVWSLSAKATFDLPATEVRDRVISAGLAGPVPDRSIDVRASLNDVLLGSFELGSELSLVEVAAPAELWRRGPNVLRLSTDRVFETVGHGEVAFGVSHVIYGEERRVEPSGDGLRLTAGTGVRYSIDPAGAARLAVGGRSRSDGRIEVEISELHPTTGRTARLGQVQRINVRGGRVERGVRLPRTDEVLELQLSWSPADGRSELVVDLLEWTGSVERPKRSVIFVSIDTLSAGAMSLYGNPRATTPNLERLADQMVVFDQCRANAPWTVPSYMSQLTGLLPRSHATDRPRGRQGPLTEWEKRRLASARSTLAERFRAAGYRTAAFVDNPWLTRGLGFEQGFDRFDDGAARISIEDPGGGVEHILPRALEWLDEDSEQPSFLFVQCLDPHAPYCVPDEWDGVLDGDGHAPRETTLPVAPHQRFAYGYMLPHVAEHQFGTRIEDWPSTARVDTIATDYLEKVAQIDAALGRLFDELESRGLLDEAVVVISADHGEETLEHGYYFGHAQLYQEVLHVPLMIRLPGGRRGGSRVRQTVQLVDLYPTLVELGFGGRSVMGHGRSLVPLVEGGELPDVAVFAEGGLQVQQSIELGEYKLIYSEPMTAHHQMLISDPRLDRGALERVVPGLYDEWRTNAEIGDMLDREAGLLPAIERQLGRTRVELYHLPSDPSERRNLAASESARVDELRALMSDKIELGELARIESSLVPQAATVGEEELDALEALGYAGD